MRITEKVQGNEDGCGLFVTVFKVLSLPCVFIVCLLMADTVYWRGCKSICSQVQDKTS